MDVVALIGFVFFLLLIYGIFSKSLGEKSISGPMVFTLIGLAMYYLGWTEKLEIEGETLEILGEIALIAILFTDASNISLKDFFKVYKLPVRLLFIGLPLTMILGSLIAFVMFDGISWIMLMVMAFILSPTDAALGQAVVQSPLVPKRIREAINVESGLNDGLALPPILICLVILSGSSGALGDTSIPLYVAKQLLLAPLVGGIIGWGGSKIINWSVKNDLSNHLFQGIIVFSLSIISYVLSDRVGGNGYIAAFVAGLFFNADSKKVLSTGQDFGEFLSQPLALFVFFCLGGAILPYYLNFIDLTIILYSVLSLTLLRIIPVLLSLIGTELKFRERLFIGWFGPRGIASILYFLLAFNLLSHNDTYDKVYATIILTVTLSIIAHGLTAVPYTNWLSKKLGQTSQESL